MEFKTTGNRVLIEREATDIRTSTGLIVQTLGSESNYYGYVVGVGPGKISRKKVLIPMTVQVGDKVLFDPNGAIPVRANGRDLLVVKEDDIVTVVDPEVSRGI